MRTAMPDRGLGAAAHVLHQRGSSRALLFGLLGVLISNAAAQDDAGSGSGEAASGAPAPAPPLIAQQGSTSNNEGLAAVVAAASIGGLIAIGIACRVCCSASRWFRRKQEFEGDLVSTSHIVSVRQVASPQRGIALASPGKPAR